MFQFFTYVRIVEAAMYGVQPYKWIAPLLPLLLILHAHAFHRGSDVRDNLLTMNDAPAGYSISFGFKI